MLSSLDQKRGPSVQKFLKYVEETKADKKDFGLYIFRVLKKVHPSTEISSKAVNIMNSFINDILERIAAEVGNLTQCNKKSTITSREIQTGAKLVLPGELSKCCFCRKQIYKIQKLEVFFSFSKICINFSSFLSNVIFEFLCY